MKVLHLICKQNVDGPGLRNLLQSEFDPDVWLSGYWAILLGDAKSLVGGMLYLHETKAKPSRFGGRVLEATQVRKIEFSRAERIVFRVLSLPEGRGVGWRGADHPMASYGNIIEVDG